MVSAEADKKRVLLVIRWPVGGIRTFVRYVYRNFDPECWQFTIIAPDLPEMRLLIDDLSVLDIRFRPVDPNPSLWAFSFCIASELARGRYDLMHSHGFTSGMCSALPAFVRRTPHLLTSHDVINEKQFAGLKGKAKRHLMGQMLGLVDTIQSVSYDAQENLLAYFPALSRKEGKCVVIVNGIEVDRFIDASPRDLRSELGLGGDFFLIGFMGRFMAQKGFRYLVEAIEILQEKNLPKKPLVMTFGDGGFIREEKKGIEDRGVEESFRFMPFTPNVAGTIKGVDVVAIPSLWEACPLLPMEALVCGTPVIGSDCIGLREVLRSTPALVVKSGDGRILADAIEKEIKESSKNRFIPFIDEAVSRFDVKKQSRNLLVLYEDMLS